MFPFNHMTVSKFRTFRSEIYLLFVIFYSPATNSKNFCQVQKKKLNILVTNSLPKHIWMLENNVQNLVQLFLIIQKWHKQLTVFHHIIFKYLKKMNVHSDLLHHSPELLSVFWLWFIYFFKKVNMQAHWNLSSASTHRKMKGVNSTVRLQNLSSFLGLNDIPWYKSILCSFLAT